MLGSLLFAAAFCVVALLVYLARYSGRVRVERRRVVRAPLAEVQARVGGPAHWAAWSPWAGKAVVEALPAPGPQQLAQRLAMQQPFAVRAECHWQFAPHPEGTEVCWRLRGRVGFSVRAFARTIQESLALDMRYGLDRLADGLEPPDAPRYAIEPLGVRAVPECRFVYRTYEGPIDALPAARAQAIDALTQDLQARGIPAAGAPLALYSKTNVKLRTTSCQIGLPVDAQADVAGLPERTLPAHRAFVIQLRGDRSALELAWYQGMQQMVAQGIRPDPRMPPLEHYLPAGADGVLLTELHTPVLAG